MGVGTQLNVIGTNIREMENSYRHGQNPCYMYMQSIIDLEPQPQVGIVLGDVWELSQGCTQNSVWVMIAYIKSHSLSSALKHNTMNM